MKYSLIILTFAITHLTMGQILNGGFEQNGLGEEICKQGSGDPQTVPFNTGNVNEWSCPHGSPQLNNKGGFSGAGCTAADRDVKSGDFSAFLSYATTNVEGIFQNIKLRKGEIISLSVGAKAINSGAKLRVKLCKGLVNHPGGAGTHSAALPNPSVQTEILNIILTPGWDTYYVSELELDDDYDQIWILPDVGTILVDDVILQMSCCQLEQYYQNITNPPSTFRNDFIVAGANVLTGVTPGPVIIDNPGSPTPVIFSAKNRIELLPGFSTTPTSNFQAIIQPCTTLSPSVTLEKITDPNDLCRFKFIARTCFGSGFYKYTWDVDGMTVYGASNQSTIVVLPRSNRTITVTVTDETDNSTVTNSFSIGPMNFVDPINENGNIAVSNVITPNGDGFNDLWDIRDLDKPNANQFAYDAYWIEYGVVEEDDMLNNFCFKTGENKTTGFPDKYINCDLSSFCVNGGLHHFFHVTDLKNCVSDLRIMGSITVICGSEPDKPKIVNNTVSIKDNSANQALDLKTQLGQLASEEQKFVIFPNPSDGLFNLKFTQELENDCPLRVYDMTGKLLHAQTLNKGSKTYNFNSGNLVNGLYLIEIKTTDRKDIQKIIVQR